MTSLALHDTASILGVVDRMSGLLRKLLGPSKARVQGYIKQAEELLSQPINEETMEDDEITMEDLIERMCNNVSIMEQCDCDWVALLRDLKGEAKVTEEREHS